MASVVVGPRVEFDTDHYPRIRYWDGDREHYLYLHRLTAYAHGLINDLWAPVDVHHVDCDGWNNSPRNLEALARHEHQDIEPHVANLE